AKEEVMLRTHALLAGVAAIALVTPALAQDAATSPPNSAASQHQMVPGAAGNSGAIGATKPNSGPGVQGPPDTRTGPSTRAPGDAGSDAAGASSGASSGGASGSGASGSSSSGNASSGTTQPSQDSSGVQGFPDTRTGPATHSP